MVENSTVTRQEAEDISGSVLDGCDSIILNKETAIGANSEEAVIVLAKSIAEAENIIDYELAYNDMRNISNKKTSAIDAMTTTACAIALENNVDIFICLTETGKCAKYVAKYKPFQPILACSKNSNVVRQMTMTRGIIGYKIPNFLCKLLITLMII